MEESFIRERITELRLKKGVSEYKMSMDIGHSKSYIQSITSGRALPSLSELLYICEYLEVTPDFFFKEEVVEPVLVEKIMSSIVNLKENDLMLILNLVERLRDSGA